MKLRKWFAGAACLLALTLVCLALLPTTAEAAKSGYYTYTVKSGKATITAVDASISGNVVIPSKLGGYPVTAIGEGAFGEGQMTSVTIPAGITSIGMDAFYWCENLTGIWVDANNPNYSSDSRGVLFDKNKTYLIQAPVNLSGSYVMPDSVITISESAFGSCDQLTAVTIGCKVTTIGRGTFGSCWALEKLTLYNSVTYIGDSNFRYCELTDIYFYGTEKEWENIESGGRNNLGAATMHYLKRPTGDMDGNGKLTTNDAVHLLLHVMFGAADYPI